MLCNTVNAMSFNEYNLRRQNKFAMRKSTNVAWMNIPIM